MCAFKRNQGVLYGHGGQRAGRVRGDHCFSTWIYDEFINSLNDLMGKDNARRKQAFFFLFKLGVGWVAGFCLSVLVLSGLFQEHIYEISSVFMGLTFLRCLWSYGKRRIPSGEDMGTWCSRFLASGWCSVSPI